MIKGLKILVKVEMWRGKLKDFRDKVINNM